MKRISFIAAAALMLVGAQLHAQAKSDSAKKGTKSAAVSAKTADKAAGTAKTAKSADKPAVEPKTTKAAGTSTAKKGTGSKRGSKTSVKKDSTAKKP